MTTKFTFNFETKSQVVHLLHFISRIVSSMTRLHECLVDFEKHMALLKHSLFYLRFGIVDSLTFGFRIFGFDYASTKNYNSKYRKDKGDIVVQIVCTFRDGQYCLEYIFFN